jgi:CRISPR-associated protein Csx17
MFEYALEGCRTRPLASYFKATAILRLLSEQKDPFTRGWWEDETFHIRTDLTKEDFEKFFCEEYIPTPIVSPWNGGSGFYPGDNLSGINAIAGSDDSRFSRYREVIETIGAWPEISRADTVGSIKKTLRATMEGMRQGKKRDEIEQLLRDMESETPAKDVLGTDNVDSLLLSDIESEVKKDKENKKSWMDWRKALKKARTRCVSLQRGGSKEALFQLCRSRLPDSVLPWIDAVYTLRYDGSTSLSPVFGTGGNEGRLDLSNNFTQLLSDLFISDTPEDTRNLFRSSVFGHLSSGLTEAKIGQYDPGRAGGFNQGMGIERKDFKINPWDFVLGMEGALVLGGATSRRYLSDERSQLSTPFTVRFSPVGFPSEAVQENRGYETWLPLWEKPAAYSEVKSLFSEGRSSVGRKPARTGIEFSRAIGTLGTDRGISSFERYAFLKRRGKSYVALPAGKIPVKYRPGVELLNELDPSLIRVRGFLRGFKNVPATYQSGWRQVESAIFAYSQKADPASLQDLVRSLGNLEYLFARRDPGARPSLTRPLGGLSPRWVEYCDDGSIEVRIAAALASIRGTGKVGPIRSNMTHVDPINPGTWALGNKKACWVGPGLADRLGSVLLRRIMDGERFSTPHAPVEGELPISSHDAMSLLRGNCDDKKIEELLWGFTLINWSRPGSWTIRRRWINPISIEPLSRAWCLLKLLRSPHKIHGIEFRKEPRIVRLLASGNVPEACDVAFRRLFVSGLNPLRVTFEEDFNIGRLLASLLVPISDQPRLEGLILMPAGR